MGHNMVYINYINNYIVILQNIIKDTFMNDNS